MMINLKVKQGKRTIETLNRIIKEGLNEVTFVKCKNVRSQMSIIISVVSLLSSL